MAKNYPGDFGTWLKSHRERLKLTQGDVAKRAGCSVSYISTIERKQPHSGSQAELKPKREKIVAIARAVKGDVDEALVLSGLLPMSDMNIPEAIRVVGFDGLDDEDLERIVDFITFTKKTNRKKKH